MREKILEAGEIIMQLADELKKAKNVVANIELIEEKLKFAREKLESAYKLLEETQNSLKLTNNKIEENIAQFYTKLEKLNMKTEVINQTLSKYTKLLIALLVLNFVVLIVLLLR